MSEPGKKIIESFVDRSHGKPVMTVVHRGYGRADIFSIEELEVIISRLKQMEEQDALELLREQG